MAKVNITKKQRLAHKALVGSGGNVENVAGAMREAGYSENTIHTPQKLTESRGFIKLCEEMGLTDELIVGSLKEDIEKKPQNRKPELELAAKLKRLIDEKNADVNVNVAILNVKIDDNEIQDYVAWRNERIHASVIMGSTEEESAHMDSGQSDEDGKRNETRVLQS